ncbi:MAG: NHL repeat-containing protein [Desulfobulbaceae bacterium]
MSAASVIIRRTPAFLLAAVLAGNFSFMPAPLFAAAPLPADKSPAGQVNALTEKDAPGAIREDAAEAADEEIDTGPLELDVVNIIQDDEQGRGFFLPSYVFHDPAADETYVVDNGRVIVYGPNFFPMATIGRGRGLITATGVYVDRDGNVYVPQGLYYSQPSRITVYNAAFFPVKDIDLSVIPGAEGANPKSLVIGDQGFIYVAFDPGLRGLLVLDQEGNFSHWLKPMDLIFEQQAIVESQEGKEQEEEAEDVRTEEPDFDVSELVPELIPGKGEQVFAKEEEPGMGPVQVNDVQRDSNGNLYLLSSETSKVYIFNDDEEYMYNFGEKGGSTGKLSQPKQLAVDEKNRAIYIVDYMRHAILIYDLSGRFMHEMGGKGNQPGWFQYPRSVATNSRGELLVADMFNRRVQVLDVQFEYKFPLFQVPFVYEQEGVPQPSPVQASGGRFYGPGFAAGEQARAEKNREEIKALLDDGVI